MELIVILGGCSRKQIAKCAIQLVYQN